MEHISHLMLKFKNQKHWLLLIYFPIYLLWFAFLEKRVQTQFHVIHMEIDNYIPFCEFFIIPYLLWFLYIAVTVLYMGFRDKAEYYRLCTFLFTGMTIFLIVSTLYPNGHYLRPTEFERNNIFTYLCGLLYQADTATNLFPSIHVYNSIGVHIAIAKSETTRNNKFVHIGSGILMTSIILSTVFLKQHSVFDLLTGLLTALVIYQIVYVCTWEKLTVLLGKTTAEKRALFYITSDRASK